MKWPYKVRHRKNGPILAKIYRPCEGRDSYRVSWHVGGQRMMKSFARFTGTGGAKDFAEQKARELAQGSQVAALTPVDARNAFAVRDALDHFRRETGRTITPVQAISEYLAAVRNLGERPLSEAVAGFLGNVASVKRVDLAVAIEEFSAARDAKTRSPDDRRAQLSREYAYITSNYLRQFSAVFQGYAVCDLTKEHLDLFMSDRQRANLAPKSRNHYRATLRQFLNWAVKKDYLPVNHRLLEAPNMERETLTSSETDYYRPHELRKMLDANETDLHPVIAMCALGGLRQQEALRLTWEDVFRVANHIEITATKSKTRSRRLIEIVPALAEWLRPYRQHTGPLWVLGVDRFQKRFGELRVSLEIPARRNGLRHAFCTYHFALHANENLTAQQAGNSPAMIHQHYKGLATKKEAQAWFAVKPLKAAANIVSLPATVGSTA